MEGRRGCPPFRAEDDADGADPERGKIDTEHVGVTFVVGIQGEPAQPGYRSLRMKHEPTASNDDLYSGDQPLIHISPRAPQRVAATEVAPHLRAVGDIGSNRLVRSADHIAEDPGDLGP